jgi:uncharacterized protein
LELSWLAGYFALGAFAGFLAGLLGVGGGMTMVPVLTMMFIAQGHPYGTLMQVVLATAMASICFTSLSSARAHHGNGNVRWDIVKALVPGALLGTLLGTTVLSQLPTQLVKAGFGLFMVYAATKMLYSASQKQEAGRAMPGPAGMFSFSLVLGGISAMLGAGGAFLSVPFMNARGVNARQAIGTSAALGVPIALFATVGYIINGWRVPNLPTPHLGYIFLPALGVIVLASIFTAPLGAKFAQRLPVFTLKMVFAGLLYILAARMLWMAFGR